ncbi:MAG: hypothetical protein HYR79_11430 [Nitrospirae bacterium]|nr:hypothetical protein [Nitrospirota bacterium]
MEDFNPILKKIEQKLGQFLDSGDFRKLMGLLASQGVWLDITLQPGGPGVLGGGEPLTLASPLKEEILDRAERWGKDYDFSFLKANRIKTKKENK